MRKLEELLEDYKSGLLSPEEERFVEEQLTEKPELLEEAQAIAFVWEAVKQQVKQDEKEKLKAQLLENTELRQEYEERREKYLRDKSIIEEKKIVPQTLEKAKINWALPVAAGLIGLFTLLYFLWESPSQEGETKDKLFSTSLPAILDSAYYKKLNFDPRASFKRGDKREEDTSLQEFDTQIAILFQEDKLDSVINRLEKNESSYPLGKLDTLKLAIAYYHTGEFETSQDLLNSISSLEKKKDVATWYRIINHLQKEEYDQAKPLICFMKDTYAFRGEEIEWLFQHFKPSCL